MIDENDIKIVLKDLLKLFIKALEILEKHKNEYQKNYCKTLDNEELKKEIKKFVDKLFKNAEY